MEQQPPQNTPESKPQQPSANEAALQAPKRQKKPRLTNRRTIHACSDPDCTWEAIRYARKKVASFDDSVKNWPLIRKELFEDYAESIRNDNAPIIGAKKRRFIEENGLGILRLHDTWDLWPGVGITSSRARSLNCSSSHSSPLKVYIRFRLSLLNQR